MTMPPLSTPTIKGVQPLPPVDVDSLLKAVFPKQQDSDITLQWIEEEPVNFLRSIQGIGRTPQTEQLLKVVYPDAGEEDFSELWPVQPTSQALPSLEELQPQIQQELNIIDAREDLSMEQRVQLKDDVFRKYLDVLGIAKTHMDIVGELYSESGVSIEEFEALTDEQRSVLIRPGEYIEVRNVNGERRAFAAGEPTSFFQNLNRVVTEAAQAPLFEIAGIPISATDIVGVALLGYIAAKGAANIGKYINLIRQAHKGGVTEAKFLDEFYKRVGYVRPKVPTAGSRAVEKELFRAYDLQRQGNTQRAQEIIDRLVSFTPKGAVPRVGAVTPQAGTPMPSVPPVTPSPPSTTTGVSRMVPRGTQTGALAFGGVPPEGVPPKVPPVVPPVTPRVVPEVKPGILIGNPSTYLGRQRIAVEFSPYTERGYEPVLGVPRFELSKAKGEQWLVYYKYFDPTGLTKEVFVTKVDSLTEAKNIASDQLGKFWQLKQLGYGIEETTDMPVEEVSAILAEAKPKTEVPAVAPAKPPATPEVTPPIDEFQVRLTGEIAKGQAEITKAIQEQGRTNPDSVPPQDARYSHTEVAAPDGPKPPKPPSDITPQAREPDDILREIAEKATPGERPDQTLLRLHEASIGSEGRRTSITVKEGGAKLNKKGIGVWTRDNLIPLPKNIPQLDELYKALHNPSGVESGEIKVPKGFEEIYEELRALTNWEESARLDFDPNMATVEDYFYRGWKPPKGATTNIVQGRPLVKTPSFKKIRVNATYQEMRDAGFEPLFWNPYQQWATSRMQGVKYREQMELVAHLKSMGEEFIRPSDGGPIPNGWRVPEVGPAFEGKPFAIADPVTGEPTVMFSRRWLVPDRIANSLENIYGKKPDLGKFIIAGKTIDPLSIIDALVFIPKRAKLMFSFFQQVDFLTRAGAGSWTRFVDALSTGRPIAAIKAPARYPLTVFKILQANFNPAKRLSLAKQLDNTTPIVAGRPGINLKGISDAGLSTRDVTIFPADMDKLVHQAAQETGILEIGRGFVNLVGDLESAMRRGLFDGVYPAAIITDIQNNIAPMVARQYSSLNDAQINGMIARIANIKYSTIPASQSVIQNRVLREGLRRVFFSIGESEGLLRQATGAFKGPYKNFWIRHWLGVYLFLIATANVIHFASTGKPLPEERYSPISKTKWGPLPFGYNRDFAAPTLPFKGRGGVELTLDIAGQLDTAFRILDPVSFITSRESVPMRTIVNQVSGTDFYGAPIDDVGPGGIISRTSQLMFDLFAPIGLGGIGVEAVRLALPQGEEVLPEIEERLGLMGLGIQATGINIRAETTLTLLDRFAREGDFFKDDGTPVEKWADLEPFQKREISSNVELQTELGLRSDAAVERQQLSALGFATLDDIDKERVVRGEALVSEFLQELMEPATFRDEVRLLKREMSARKAQVDYDFQLFEDTGKLPTDPNKRALVEYYNTFDRAKRLSGVIDWDEQERLENLLRSRWSDAQGDYVDRNTGLTEWGPLMAEYTQAIERLKPYWELPPKPMSIRKKYRIDFPEVDAILVQWYGYKPAVGQPTTPEKQLQDIGELLR